MLPLIGNVNGAKDVGMTTNSAAVDVCRGTARRIIFASANEVMVSSALVS